MDWSERNNLDVRLDEAAFRAKLYNADDSPNPEPFNGSILMFIFPLFSVTSFSNGVRIVASMSLIPDKCLQI